MIDIEKYGKFLKSEDIDFTVNQAILSNNLGVIKNILFITCYSFLNQEEKEEVVFKTIYSKYARNLTDDSFLKYLILDYKISENNSIKNIRNLNIDVKNMFESRSIKEELEQNLITNIHQNKKPKV
jgi:hypothetical protein